MVITKFEKMLFKMLFVLVCFVSFLVGAMAYDSSEKSSKVLIAVEENIIQTIIGDSCDDKNELTNNDMYVNTRGTCEGIKIENNEEEVESK